MKKGSGGRITSLTLEEKGGWEGGREREGAARRCDGKRCGSGSGGIRRGPGVLEGGGVASQSEAGGGGGSSPHCARSSCRRRLDPAAMAAAVAEAAPFRPQAAAPRLLPIRRGHGNPATASVSLGAPSPVQSTSAAALTPRASAPGPLRKCPRCAPSPEPCQRLRGRLLLASFLPLSLGPGGGSGSTNPHSPEIGRAHV